jgi:tetratricopeptide (TPR) repeat protein/Cdc6-like AAA superfamily ATPase
VRFRSRLLLALAFAASSPLPALAAREWYDYYLQARDRDIPEKRWTDCVKDLRSAMRLRPTAGTNVRTYGQWFVDYLPEHYLGVCLLRMEDYVGAVEAFDRAEQQGAVKKAPPQHTELLRLRAEAQSAQATQMTRRAVTEVQRKMREAQDLGRRRAWDDALARLAEAEAIAKGLDADTLRAVNREQERLRGLRAEAADTTARGQRLDQRLADGQRLLDEGKPTEADLAFREALDVDPKNTAALEGRKAAQARILESTTRLERQASFQQGKALFDAGQYEQALGPLTDAAADPSQTAARELLARARKVVDGLREQKQLREQIDSQVARGEALMKAGRFPEAQVAFESARRLDPGHARAREQLAEAERRTGEALIARWLPNQEPALVLIEPEAPVLDSPTYSVQGVAIDDRGIARLEFRVDGKLVAEESPDAPPADPQRYVRFVRLIPLSPGTNQIVVTAIDSGGLTRSLEFAVSRRLRFYETRWFLPAAFAGALGLVGLGVGAQRVRRQNARRRRFNPYIAGAPVLDDDMFYGREQLTQRMLGMLHRNSLMITGERRFGKTTFLHHLRRVLEEDEGTEWRFFPVFVDLQGVPEEAFFHAIMSEVVDTLSLTPATRDALRFAPEPDGYDARDFSHDLQQVLAELRTRTPPPRKVKIAFLIDEVDVLNSYSETVNQRLRGIFMKSFSENLVAVMSGVAIRRRWKSEVSPWYNFFDEIELQPFTREEAEALIREPVKGVFRFAPDAVERILALSRLRPYLVQKLCVHAMSRMLEQGRFTVGGEDVEAARAAMETDTLREDGETGAAPRPALLD